jgi:hypothetical protein
VEDTTLAIASLRSRRSKRSKRIYQELMSIILSHPSAFSLETPRRSSFFAERMNWEQFIMFYGERAFFKQHLRMTKDSFNKLLSYVAHDLETNEVMASLRGGAILPEIRLYCALRWLAGGCYSDIQLVSGISKPSFYRVLWLTIHAINRCPELAFRFPETYQECFEHAQEFEKLSTNGAFDQCVGAIDGWLLEIKAPSTGEVSNARSFFNGHYQHYGINVQMICDAHCRITYLAAVAAGGIEDNDAYKEKVPGSGKSASDRIEALPVGFYVVADDAYAPTEHVLSTFGGNEARKSENDNFNYGCSQLRIRVEMTLGLMRKKWGIVARQGRLRIGNYKYVMNAVARLHNFCSNERIRDGLVPVPYTAQKLEFDLPIRVMRETGMDALSEAFPQWSIRRRDQVERVKKLGFQRPACQSDVLSTS